MQTTTKWQVFPKEFSFTDADISWLNASGLPLEIANPSKLGDFDSGWCDASTGYEIVTSGYKIFVTTKTPEEETWLKLYWEDKVLPVEWTQYEINNIDTN